MYPTRLLTWYSPDGQSYCAAHARSSGDIAIPDRPADMQEGGYNVERGEWECCYDAPSPDDISIGEAEQLWAKAQAGDVIAGVLLKVAGL